jgi:cytochrome c oxidase subunit 2
LVFDLLDHDRAELMAMTITQLEKRIFAVAVAFVMLLFGFAALAVNVFHVGLPTCLTSVKPFQKGELIAHSPTHYELHYVARMWKFEPEEVTVPAGSIVDVYLSTIDVTHGLILVGTDLNLMAVPGVVNYARVKFDQPRVYPVICHEYCGTGHDRMAASLRVVDAATFRATKPAPPAAAATPADLRSRLLVKYECFSCHSLNGVDDIGPSFKGLYGRVRKMSDGSVVTADDAYLRESILHPDAKVVEGFDDVMPAPTLTDEEVNEIIAYLKTIK